MDAMARSLRSEVAWAAFIVEAMDEEARSFYLRFGFQCFGDERHHLLVMRGTIEPLFRGRGLSEIPSCTKTYPPKPCANTCLIVGAGEQNQA